MFHIIEQIFNNFWGISGSILLVCFTAYLTFRHTQQIRRQTASDNFRNTILSELKGLYPTPVDWPERSHDVTYILKAKFPEINRAVTEYSRFVNNRKEFLRDWDFYRMGDKETATGEQDYFQYTGAYFDDQEPPNPQDAFQKNVGKLLSHCERT